MKHHSKTNHGKELPIEPAYSLEPQDKRKYKESTERLYTRIAVPYDLLVKLLPTWKNWTTPALPFIEGPRVLEVSFGTGYLMTRYAGKYETYGIDYNRRMASITKRNLKTRGLEACIQIADVEAIPYQSESIDTILNTMAFSGYPDGGSAMCEVHRVLRTGGKLIIVDVNFPEDRNWLGTWITQFWGSSGDIIRDMGVLLDEFNFAFSHREIGGFGSVHLYIAKKLG